MPEGYRFKFLTDNADPQALHDWIETQSADFPPPGTDPAGAESNARWGLVLACKTQLDNIGTWIASGSGWGDPEVVKQHSGMLDAVVCASLRLRDSDLFKTAVTRYPRMISLTMWERVGSMMELAHFSSYRDS